MLRSKALLALAAFALSLLAQPARAGNPRWVKGPPYFNIWYGLPVLWYTRTPLYYTDPGDLSPYVNHAAADAIVAAAANVWNVPTATFEIAQGGTLDEHVDSTNTYFGINGMVFPSDVQSSNFPNKQIAVIYDSDGYVTDLLLGQGASSPMECLQNAVTESVDSISRDGYIQHAIVVLNGRCTGPAPEQQLQMQYQLERVLGRVIGLGWSQTNDNVFTRTPVPTYEQALHWPIMHPIDIVCGPYTYQCLPQPFTLRDDDIASISFLYLMGLSNQFGWTGYNYGIPGKTQSYDRAAHGFGTLTFASGQGMQGVNLEAQRYQMFNPVPEPWYDVSTVTGYLFQQNAPNPVTGTPTGLIPSMGTNDPGQEGYFDFGWIPMVDDQQGWVNITVQTEAINPLYTGSHAVGPYTAGTVSPAGVPTSTYNAGLRPNDYGFLAANISFTMSGSQPGCPVEIDGAEIAPAQLPASGFFTGALCGRGHSSWFSLAVPSGHTATAEVTALDESGRATQTKARPLLGVWKTSDAPGSTPSVAATPVPFNSLAAGTTGLVFPGSSVPLRLAVTDARGDGRPDFAYSLRVLYAGTVQPSTVGPSGGPVTITGIGFRQGNQVLVNGVSAVVTSSSANSITAVAPAASTFARTPSSPVNVTVNDLQTGATSTITGAVSYGTTGADVLALLSAPSGTIPIGARASTPFAVRVLLSDGITPLSGVPVSFTASGGSVQFSGCSGSPCSALTDATGVVSVSVTPQNYGAVTLQAAAVGSTLTTAFTASAKAMVGMQTTLHVAPGVSVVWKPALSLFENGVVATGIPVHWSGSAALAISSADTTSNPTGFTQAVINVAPLSTSGQAVGQACGWLGSITGPVCTPLTVIAVSPDQWRVSASGGVGQSMPGGSPFAPVSIAVTDTMGDPVAGASITIYQSITQSQMQCPARGVCPVAASLAASQTTAISDINGTVSFQPLQVPGVAQTTDIAVSSGTQGFVSISLARQP
jgi:hypothetical protein